MVKHLSNPAPHTGRIEAICGPMFSGKSEELIRRLKCAQIARKHIAVFKPTLDTRYSDYEIVSHGNARICSEPVDSASAISAGAAREAEVIGIDEANLFGDPLIEVVNKLANAGKQVIVAGLDTDYLGLPFPPMPHLLAIAESITKLLAVCVRCGAPAQHTQRLVESEELILVGAVDSYEARCRNCFEPGIPRRHLIDFVPSNSRALR